MLRFRHDILSRVAKIVWTDALEAVVEEVLVSVVVAEGVR
jgi:hypothetical protein